MAGRKGVFFDTSTWSADRPARPLPPRAAGAGRLRLRLPVRPAAGLALHRAPHRVRAPASSEAQLRGDARRQREPARRRRRAARADQPARVPARSSSRCSSRGSTSTSRWRCRSSGLRQPDTIGALGLALNACAERNGHAETHRADRASCSRPRLGALGDGCPELERRGERLARTPPDVAAHPHRRRRGGDECLSSASTAAATALDAPGRARRSPRRSATRSASPGRRSPATRATAAPARCSSTARRCSRASRSPTGSTGREVTTIEGLRDHPMVDAFVRADALQCGFCTPGQIVSAVALVEQHARPVAARRSGTAWPATSAAAAPTPRSRRRSARGATDPHREGGRGPVRGGLPRRRRGPARAVARRARATSSAGRRRAPTGSPGPAARRSSPATSGCPGMLHTAVLRSPHARARGPRASTSRRRSPRRGVRGAIGPGDSQALAAELQLRGRRRSRPSAPTRSPGARRARADRRRVGGARAAARPRRGGRRAASSSTTRKQRARRPRARPRRGGRRRRGDLPHPGRAAQLDGDAPVGRAAGSATRSRSTSRRSTSGACATSVARGARARPRPRARVLRLHGRRLRLEERRRRPHASSRPSSRRRTGRPVRCALTRREENIAAGNRNATIQRLVAGARADGTLTALGGEYVNAVGWSGLERDRPRGRCRRSTPARTCGRRRSGARLNLPPMKAFRAPGLRRGHVRPRVPARRARGEARPRPARAAAPQPRRRRARRRAGEYSGKNLLECYRRAEPHWERRHEVRARSTATVKRGVGMASQIWFGGGGPPSYAWIRVGSNGHAAVVTGGQDVGTGTKTALAQIAAEELGIPLEHVHDRGRRLGPRAVRDALGRLLDGAVDGPGRARGRRPTRGGRSSSSRPSATTADAGDARARARRRSCSPDGEPRAARGDRRAARERPDPRRRRARAEPGRDARAHLRRAGGRGRRRRRDGRGDRRARRGDPRRRPRDQPARRLEPDRGRDHPGDRAHASPSSG